MTARGPVALVVNPVSTRTTAALRSEVVRILAPLGLERTLVTRGPGDAGRLAALAAADGASVVVTLGGDGTAAEAAGALAGGPVAMAPLPAGNANVFARALGWSNRPHEALAALARALGTGAVRDAHLGLLRADGRERVFVVNAGMGLDAATVEWIEARPRAKRRLRQAGFAVGAAIAVVRARGAPRLTAVADGGPPVEAVAVLTACGTPYTYLGARPLDLAPGAAFGGELAWVGLTRARPAELARLLVRAARGRPLPLGGEALRGGPVIRELRVTSPEPAPVQADGEALGSHRRLEVVPGPVLRAVQPRPIATAGGP